MPTQSQQQQQQQQRPTRGNGNGNGNNKTKKPKLQVMEHSDQTDAERRDLRRALRNLQTTIVAQADALEDAKSDSFAKIRNETNGLWKQVRYTREAVLDGENLETIATRAARQVDKLVEVPRYDAVRFAMKLKQNLSNGNTSNGNTNTSFDWAKLGSEVGVCFNALPSGICFLAGPLNADYTPKQRKKVERRVKLVDSDAEEEEPEDVKEQAKDGDKLSAVEQNIHVVETVLAKKCRAAAASSSSSSQEENDPAKRRRVGEISAVETLFNPKSFTQTVENLFHFSFILKKGGAQIYSTADKGPMVHTAPAGTDEHPPPRQAILSLTMRDWRRMTKAQNMQTSLVPHRTGSRHMRAATATASSQSSSHD
eukprot:CAMPEP_0119007946 /NCGR_PEP_ID=MMETSP1176-20130426/3352_1 /TAXON_ID=265551 /ORGANISM="Synedropsis recta cf, Strain CCMP1620" /LENGTH=367 /DNA_ID=CAMNT_0006960183 /DNA_START=46 /DNA_END=1149 /DNA_ORIENTATION=+